MKKLILLLLSIAVVGCVDIKKFDDLKVEVDTSLPIGTYGITAEDFVNMLGLDVAPIAPDKVIEISYKDDSYSVIDENMIADIVKIDDQSNPASFNLTKITNTLSPGQSKHIVIDGDVADVFSSNAKLSFKDKGRPSKIIFSGAKISVNAVTGMPQEDLYVEIESITQNGVPLVVGFGESKQLDASYVMNVGEEDGEDPYMVVSVKGSTTISSNSTLSMSVSLSEATVKYIEGDLGRQVEDHTSIFGLGDISKGLDNVEEFYPADIAFNLHIDNAFESLPMLVQIEKMSFIHKNDASKDVDIDIKKGLGFDRFFMSKGPNTIHISNNITKSGKGLSDAFSKDLSDVEVQYTIIVNPTDADADGDVPQDKSNKVSVDTKISSSANFNIPMQGYIKGVAIDTVMAVDFKIDEFSANDLQYNISAINSFPLDLDVLLVVMEKVTNTIISDGSVEPIKIKGAGALTYNVANVRTIKGEALKKLFNNEANLGLRLRGNTVGVDNKEIVSFLGGDNMNINLFLGFNGVFSLNNRGE